MSGLVRRGGRGTLADGRVLTWSVAEGSRGRRWRATIVRDGALVSGLLLETGTDGRPARLELDTVDGLLTLHPSHDGRALHGNVVTPVGLRHVELAWSADHELLVDGHPVVAMAAADRIGRVVPVGESLERPAILVDRGLRVGVATVRVERRGADAWLVTAGDATQAITVDAEGLPAGLGHAATWPLEA